jgi:hypothetical protein
MVIFIFDFPVKFILAPCKVAAFKRNWPRAIATFCVGRDTEDNEANITGAKSIEALQNEITTLRANIQALTRQNCDAL